jgi:serine/threonine protein kinase
VEKEAVERVRKFLPLKLDAALCDELATAGITHRVVKVLLITMDDSKADSTLLFINTAVEVSIADYDIDSDTIKLSQFEAIFIDGDYYEEDSPELVAHFCSHIFSSLPVILCAKSEELRQLGLKSGARACSRLPLEALTEETFESIFAPDKFPSAATYPLQKHRIDLVRLQEEKVVQMVAQEAALVSLYDKGQERHTNAGGGEREKKEESAAASASMSASQCDSVLVESKSHSLVGTLYFIAPEVIRLRRYGKAVDWWACGITIYESLARKHLFQGENKKAIFDNIMYGPIVLDELAPFGGAVLNLVGGLVNRDIKRRLGSGSQGAQAIKSHKLFEKIDWATVSTSNPVHKPAQFVSKKFRTDDRDLFYGPRDDHDAFLRPEQLAERNSSSMAKYLSNKKRAPLSAGGSFSYKSGKVDRKMLNAARKSRSRSLERSKHSGSLENVVEEVAEDAQLRE